MTLSFVNEFKSLKSALCYKSSNLKDNPISLELVFEVRLVIAKVLKCL
jgi:hypothetical protein